MIDLDLFGITLEQYLAHRDEYEALGEEQDAALASDLPRGEKLLRFVVLYDRMTRIVPSDKSWLPLGGMERIRFSDASLPQLATALGYLDKGLMKKAVRDKLYGAAQVDGAPADSELRYLITIKYEGAAGLVVKREPICGWVETTDDYTAWEPPSTYHFVERADGKVVGGVYGPRVFLSLNDEHDDGPALAVERSAHKMAVPGRHRTFDSQAAAEAWVLDDVSRTPFDDMTSEIG